MARTKASLRKIRPPPARKSSPAISGVKKPVILKISLKKKLNSLTKELKDIKEMLLVLLDANRQKNK